MDENKEVIPKVQEWLRRKYPEPQFKVEQNPPNMGADLYVESFSELPANIETTTLTLHIQVECKGSNADVDRAIGQSLGYFVISGEVPTYLAVPENYFAINHLKKVIEKLDLPIGLLVVHKNELTEQLREAKGEPRTRLLKELVESGGA